MTNMIKDYYKILGVSESCTAQELKIAYRKLAIKYHPDVAGNSEEVVTKFKEINEAYEILSNKTKKAEYDTLNKFYNYSSDVKNKSNDDEYVTQPDFTKNNANFKTSEKNSSFSFNWNDFISKYKEYVNNYNNKSNVKYGNSKNGKNIYTDLEVTIAEALNGTEKVINMLHSETCPKCNGRKFVNGATCLHCKGKGTISEHKKFNVKIPAGIKNNSKIRLAGEGEQGINGGLSGDMYITVHIKSPLDYKTEGNNIIKSLALAPHEAVLGCNISVKTLDGSVNVKIAPNTQNGQKIRLCGCGINNKGIQGDMILTIEIQIPKNISQEEIQLYKKLQNLSALKR